MYPLSPRIHPFPRILLYPSDQRREREVDGDKHFPEDEDDGETEHAEAGRAGVAHPLRKAHGCFFGDDRVRSVLVVCWVDGPRREGVGHALEVGHHDVVPICDFVGP